MQGSRQPSTSTPQPLAFSHLALDFRREDLSEMLDTLALVADEIRPPGRLKPARSASTASRGRQQSEVAHRVAAL